MSGKASGRHRRAMREAKAKSRKQMVEMLYSMESLPFLKRLVLSTKILWRVDARRYVSAQKKYLRVRSRVEKKLKGRAS